MLRSPELARETTLAKNRNDHGTDTSSEGFTVDSVCITLPVVLKYEEFRPPEKISGTALFYLYDKNYAFGYITLCYAAWHRARLAGPGTRRLAL